MWKKHINVWQPYSVRGLGTPWGGYRDTAEAPAKHRAWRDRVSGDDLATCYVNTECSELSLGAGKAALLCACHHYKYWGPAMEMAGTTLTLGRDRQKYVN